MRPSSAPTWHILGAGAIGCLWANALANAGCHIELMLKEHHKAHWHGKIQRLNETRQVVDLSEAKTVTGEPLLPIKRLLITTKAYDSIKAVSKLSRSLTECEHVMVLMNGLGAQQTVIDNLRQHTPASCQFWLASTTDGVWCPERFAFVHAGRGLTQYGCISGNTVTQPSPLETPSPLRLTVQHNSNIEIVLWRKFAINCAINPLTATHKVANGELVSNPTYLKQMTLLCDEIEAVAAALQIKLFDKSFEAPLINQASKVAQATASNYSSMYQDCQHGRKTEVDFMTGYLLQQAQKLGVPTPLNEALFKQVKTIENSA